MNIALSGYGKMGHEVEEAAKSRGHRIAAIFDIDPPMTADALKTSGAEVIIDFTQPDAVLRNVDTACKAGIPIVIGTTGWDEKRSEIETTILKARIGCVYASNFSIGVNLFLKIVVDASALIDNAGYDAYLLEAHHNKKKDYPSGTALRLAEAVVSGLGSKSKIISQLTNGKPLEKDELLISSIRAGSITGTHTVGFESDVDSIELTHRAKSRQGFASGAVRAAEWIVSKKGIYRFEEKISEIIGV